MFFSFSLQAQVDEEEKDSVKTGVDLGKLSMPNPQSIVDKYTYDPVSNRYIYTSSVDGFNINYPMILTPKQYEELVLREQMRKYYQEKSAAIDGKKSGSEAAKKDLLPRYYVNSKFFESIFGSNTIDVKPTGSVELDLGVRFTKQDNPSFSPRNRRTTSFDFDQRISVGLQGKVGTRLNVNVNYDTQSTFAFQNLIKLEYTPTEDDIIKKIEVGNVSFPLSNSLVRGAQSLFGVKAQLQFGKTTFTGVFSEQKSQTKSVTAQGGGTLQDFELFALDYDADRHYFLSQYFRNNYDKALETFPLINSRVQINRIEVWITNKQNRVNTTENNLRNIVALQDLGEAPLTTVLPQETVHIDLVANPTFYNAPANSPSDNSNNKYDPNAIGSNFLNSAIRDVSLASNGFNIVGGASEGVDFAKLENARKLTPSEYTFHPQLGYISLNQRLANDEVLAVAYQYTIGGDVYQVGEFGTDGVDATNVGGTGVPNSQALVLKLLKSNLTIDKYQVSGVDYTMPTWNLMMKNIYQIPGGYQLQQEDFKLNILYTDPSPLNYITQSGIDALPSDVEQTPLLKVFNLDKLNYTNDPQEGGDGFFDFYPGLTVDTQRGKIIFTTVEPFGKHLFEKLDVPALAENYDDPLTYNSNQAKYVFRSLYKTTQAAALQESAKNKFQLKGRFKSMGGDGISIGAFNVPQGSVVVTAGGRVLVEGVDYTVNYQMGKVQILDPSLQASNTPIEVSVENNSVFGQQTRRFWGLNVEHKFNDKFLMGATILNMSERPFTTKSNYGQESVNNTIFGFNTNYSTEIPFLTRLVNKLPNIDTDVPSNLSFRGEIAYLKPGASKADQFNGEATTYIDDFEGSQTTIDMRSPQAWTLSSVPLEGDYDGVATTAEPSTDDLSVGYKRSKLAWYSIDPVFYTQTPSGVDENDLSFNTTRRVFSRELYPVTDIAQGQSTVINTLDLTYFPKDRGPYNFNPSLAATNQFSDLEAPDTWAGIMRSINSTNFEQSNVEYIQFWVMDPYYGNAGDKADPTNTGKLVFNLGEISEDILRDGRKLYENGLPETDATQPVVSTAWGQVPASQSLIYAFDTNEANRNVQDAGFDGLTDLGEASKYPDFASYPDPAADNYQFYLQNSGDIITRYRNYNGFEGNSPVNVTNDNRGNTTFPDVEDVNRDNTMNTINAYFKFEVPLIAYGDSDADVPVGQNYIADFRTDNNVDLPNGSVGKVRWILFKIPILEITDANKVGPISDFRSIRFMRMYMSGFKEAITLRFGALDLVRGEWRRYTGNFDELDPDPDDENTGFDVVALNIQENGQRSPINYVTPPGVVREQLYNNNTIINQNEQSLSLRVYDKLGGTTNGLENDDARAVFKNVNVDMRQFKKLRMFLHAEAVQNGDLQDDELIAFIRFGNDFTDNFYQVEIPLKVTSFGASSPDDIWPSENEIEISLDLLTKLKILALQSDPSISIDLNGIGFIEEEAIGSSNNRLTLGIKGNPNFGLVRTLMIGIKNKSGSTKRGEVWFNELRMSDMDNKGGYAAVANLDTNLADFANVSATTRVGTIGFGALEQGPNERSREDVFQYDIVTNVNLGKLLPKKWGINLPFNYAVGEETITPKYDPFYQDIELNQLLDITSDPIQRSNIEERAIDYTKRTSFNLIGVKKEKNPEKKTHFYDVENLTLSYSLNETEHHDYEIENLIDKQNRTTVDYAYTFKPKTVEPFKNTKAFKKSGYYKMLSDLNFNYLPSNISFSSNIIRQFNRQRFRLVDVQGIGLGDLYRRNYFFNYTYGFNYNITKSLRLNYTASSNNIVRNYLDENNLPIDGLDIWDDYWNVGESNQHNQQLVVNYDLPINKIPLFSFVKSTYSYTGDYNWQRSSDAFSSVTGADGNVYALGNTIQNANSHKLNTTLNMDLFYKYIGLTKTKRNKKVTTNTKDKNNAPKPGQQIKAPKGNVTQERGVFMSGLIGVITSVKNIQINYTENNGTVLPGYLPGLGFFGSSKPTLGFVFGSQSDVRYEAARNGWLTTFPEFNQNFTQIQNKKLNVTAQMEVFPDFKIDLTADRTYAYNFSEQFDVTAGQYNSRAPYDFGNFNISTILISTAFTQSDVNFSKTFQEFRDNRIIIADRLAERYYGNSSFLRDAEGYPLGYGKNSQQVLLPAFLAAYSGQSADKVSTGVFRNVPLPNWTIKYTGLMRYKWFKDNFKRFSIQHGYRASYNVNAFRSNLNSAPLDANGNFFASKIISNVNLAEQFNPLVKVEFEMKNSIKVLAELKKDRTLNMSFDNNLLTEVSGNEYIIGLGYRIKDVTINSSLADNAAGIIKSDINIKADFSLRKNNTIVRYLDYDNNQLGGGQDLWSVRLTADYSFSKNLTAIFFYDHQFSQAVISTSFPTTNIRGGFTLRYNFGN
ncbi:T9SS outer membrane translocon Sov/SprA [Flavobacterium cyclinae]|uniref:T9SS outer membrane translocon Sov/SprA n=1 Tax=Flavobacterium cyclinae TaxID=2895947 RepID=UPI001E5FF55A|nr:cell surface protein SprA [Flavobacterium cyclinae]UGS22361.1 cell surface protein SprA [Flavobacterium cyclinae]